MLNLDGHFLPVFDRLDPTSAYPGTYNSGLVVTSVAIAILAAFVALSISGRITAAKSRRTRYAWASAGAISMGGGIWSMHFVGMLAFSVPCGIAYEPVGTVLSMIPGMLASGAALGAISKTDEPGLSRRFVSAILMGVGIGAMHYSGMAAMRPEALLRYDPGLVALSIVVAVALAFVSISIRFQFQRPQSSRTVATVTAALVMGCAVAGMHYTAMQASIFFPLPEAPSSSMALSPTLLAFLITIFTVLIAVSTLVATFAGRQNELALNLSAEISRRKHTEEDLRRSEAYLADAQTLSHTGSWAFNVKTRQINHASEEQFRMFGFDPGERMPVWEDWVRRIHPDDREQAIQTLRQKLHERTDYELDFRLFHPKGTIKYIHVLGHSVLNRSGDLIELVGTSIDVTERKQAEEARLDAQSRLAHANRVTTMGHLTASIAHEVNQPLGAVVNAAGACRRWLDGDIPNLDEARLAVDWIVKEGNRASEVIRRVRTLARKTDIEKVPLDLNDVVREALALVRRELASQRVSLRVELASALPSILGDRVQLQQVIINLVMNGLEAMQSVTDRPRELAIQSRLDGTQQVLVSVTDCGVGISAKDADRLFNAFFTTKASGMGMGLSICRSIIEAHGGRLWATANIPYGAMFQFTLPVDAETAS
jgi:PAS domain S-box-containing protein